MKDSDKLIDNLHVVIRALSTSINFISGNLERVGGALIILMMLTIVVEVTVRTFWDTSTRVAFDIVGILLGCAVFLGLAGAYANKAHVRIAAFVRILPKRVRDILDEVVLIVTIVYSFIIFRYTLALTIDSFKTGIETQTLVRIPLFPFLVILPIGTLVFLMVLISVRSASKLD